MGYPRMIQIAVPHYIEQIIDFKQILLDMKMTGS